MINLLSKSKPAEPFPPLDAVQRARFESRLHSLARAASFPDFLRRFERLFSGFDGLLDELESAASLGTALDLLDGIDRARTSVLADLREQGEGSPDPSALRSSGDLILYRPGRSLSTGEAGVASRGFFDVLDRPPVGFWIEAVARPTDSTRHDFEIAIIAWLPENEVERATDGRRACTTGSLALLDETSQAFARSLHGILEGRSGE